MTKRKFSSSWLKSIVLPIPTSGKDHSNPTNYRPIPLTNILCKTLKRMVNSRIIEHQEQNNILSKFQCGGRRKRSTIDHLIFLESTIRKGQANNEEMVSIFFDMEKAYDTTWRYGILENIYSIGVQGEITIFIRKVPKQKEISS